MNDKIISILHNAKGDIVNIREKLYMNREQLIEHGPITIVAFGDSVTHGALWGEINYETAYWNRLRQKINALRDYVPVNVINAGIGATMAKDGVARMEKQVICHNPDVVIVCFGLNDVNEPIEDYLKNLTTIFARCKENGAEVVFMTPNMLNTYVADDITHGYEEYAAQTAEYQNSGRMDMFMNEAINLAKSMDVLVCDCYGEWKKLSETQDVTKLLINRINHPTAEMHELFAKMLFDLLFTDAKSGESESTMFNDK